MLLKKYLVAASTVCCLASGVAGAAIINFQFTGTVTYGGSLADTGSQFSGIFSYDTDALPLISTGNYASYAFTTPFVISATINGHSVAANNLNVSVWDNFNGNVEDMIDVSGGSVAVDGNTYMDGSFGFRLSSAPGNTNVLNGTSLPSLFDVNAFNAGSTLNYGWLQSDGGPSGQLLQFSVDSIVAPVPLPPSLLLTLSGMLTLGGVIRRKSKQT